MSDLGPYIKGCNSCRLCEGAAYQLPPFLYAGSSNPQIMIIAQNPGEISDTPEGKWRMDLIKLLDDAPAETIKTIYDVDFITSHGYSQMEKIFGENWLTHGKFMYTNAVRCRTIDNVPPSSEMEINCMAWTSQLPITKIVVLMGKVAMRQFCNMVSKPELEAWKKVKLTRGRTTTYVITIPHYAAMRSHKDIERAKLLFEDALSDAEVSL